MGKARMNALPAPARLYVSAVITGAAIIMATHLSQSTFSKPWLFAGLLLLSSFTSAFKVALPIAKSGSTMSVSYAVDFASLLLLGPDETMLVPFASGGG